MYTCCLLGASRRVINMEWDKFWSENKKILESIAPRYMANSLERKVLMTVSNLPSEITVDSVQIHPQKPEMGMRALRKYNSVYLEVDDCNAFAEGEEVCETCPACGEMAVAVCFDCILN